jgi:hypothetical protein
MENKKLKKSLRDETRNLNIVHPYIPLNSKINKPLSSILKPSPVPFKISSVINGSPK